MQKSIMQKSIKMPAKLRTLAKITHNYPVRIPPQWFTSRGDDISMNFIISQSTVSATKSSLRCCLLIAILLIVPGIISGLKDVSVTIPQAVKRGSNAMLICNYDMENDTLYSVKWYKGRREFYRYTPKENPAMKVFPMTAGLSVERNLSNQSHVVLLAVPLNISGKFTCEISVEAPTFQTAMVSGELEVVELPEEQAIVTSIQPRYRIGDLVDGNCSIKYSKPAANLTWTINGIVVPLHHIKTYQIERYEESNLESVVSALHFMVTTQHFIKGQMRLKCTASIFDIFKEEIESVIEEDRPRIMASGRSYDRHNNYPYEQQASGDGFEDHNESFLTYSAADITSSATSVHGTTARIYAKALQMHWKHIFTALMAGATAIRASSSQQRQPEMELQLMQHRSLKWISAASVDEEGAPMKDVAPLEMLVAKESVAYMFATILSSVFLFALTRHFISSQRSRNESAAVCGEQAMLPRRASSISPALLSKVVAMAFRKINGGAVTTAAATKSTTATAIVKWTFKGRKSFHNCVGKMFRSLRVRLVKLQRLLLKVFMHRRAGAENPLQKLQLMNEQEAQQQQQQPHESMEAHFQSNANKQLSLTVAGRSPSIPMPKTFDALIYATLGVSAATHGAIRASNTTTAYSSRCARGGGSYNQAIANFTKDMSKDQTLLMMIAQRFDCQHVDDFVTVTSGVRRQQQQQLQKAQLPSVNNEKLLANAKVFTLNRQEIYPTLHPCCTVC